MSELNRNDLSDMHFGTNLRQPGVRLPTRGHERTEVDEACARARVLMSKPEREQSSIFEVNSSRATNRSRALTRHHLSPPPLRAIPVLRNEPLHIRSSQSPLSRPEQRTTGCGRSSSLELRSSAFPHEQFRIGHVSSWPFRDMPNSMVNVRLRGQSGNICAH
jgi:hypothetical protein